MLRKIRIVLASFFMIAVTLLFLDYTGTVHSYLGWTAKVQYAPAMLAGNAVIVVGLLLLTLLFGRVYCSAVCPLGIFQDKMSRIAGIGKKNRFGYRPPRKAFVVTRYAMLVIFVLALIANIPFISVLLEPYSAYGRMISQIAAPLYKYANNILAHFAERAGSYAFYTVDVWMKSTGAFAFAIVTFLIISAFAWKSGRGYCNSICPVGALLGIIYPVMKIKIDMSKCNKCGLCAKNCKAGCIDSKQGTVDRTRCVVCFNCLDRCPKGSITYCTGSGKQSQLSSNKGTAADMKNLPVKEDITENSADNNLAEGGLARRALLGCAALLGLSFATRAVARTYDFDGGLAPLEDKKAPERKTAILPPGSYNARNFRRRCTGCQLCVSACPNQVLRPSSKLSGFMQPHMSFERGYCRPECVKCSQVCPTGAISAITAAEKSATQIGYAVWNKERCVVNADKVQCDLCSRKCPTGAITLISQTANEESALKIPMIDTNRCIGCGACEQLCPSRPFSAIYVEGVEAHRTI